MFTDMDFIEYLDELQTLCKRSLTITTDLMNDLNHQEVRSKIRVIANEDLESFRFLKNQKENFK